MKKTFYFLVFLLLCISLMIIPIFALDPIDKHIRITSLSKYRNLTETTDLPDYFISYEQLSFLGEFEWFEYFRNPQDTYTGSPNYQYAFVDLPNEKTIVVGIYSAEKYSEKQEYNEKQNLIRDQYSENVIYYTSNEQIHEIALKIDSFWIDIRVIALDEKLSWKTTSLSATNHDLINKLLDEETVDEAYEELVCRVKGLPLPGKKTPADSNNAVDNNTADTNNTTADTNTTPDNTAAVTDTEQTLIEKLKSFDFGCQSVISGSAVTLILCSTAALAFIPKKKKRE